jgi:uncharacterized membrane protein
VDILMCGYQQAMPNWGIDAPYAVITPSGDTVVFNRCVPGQADGGCTMVVYRWTAATGTLKIASNTWAFAVSDDGGTVLAVSNPGNTNNESPFLLDGSGAETPLGMQLATLLSADGSVVVGHQQTNGSEGEAVRWTAAGGMVPLGDLPGGPDASWPLAINGDASVVVGYGNTAAGQEPFRWTAGTGAMIDLGLLSMPPDTVQAEALATTADGAVVAGMSSAPDGREYFRWTAAGGPSPIAPVFDDLPGLTSYFFIWQPRLALTADGAVITGTTKDPANPMSPSAFQWRADTGTVLLTPGKPSIVRGVSRAGDRVLGSYVQSSAPMGPPTPLTPPVHTPFIWWAGVGAYDLRPTLQSWRYDLGTLTLGEPIALTPDGTVMVGHASCGDVPVIYRAVLVNPGLGPP